MCRGGFRGQIFFRHGGLWFLQGVLKKNGCNWWYFRGEFVVNCVVDEVIERPVFRLGKM
jgi:hypothetical protein